MALLTIRDTGFISVGNESSQTRLTGNNVANPASAGSQQGQPLTLKVIRNGLRYARSIVVDGQSQPANFSGTASNYVSVENPTLSLTGIIEPQKQLSSALGGSTNVVTNGTTRTDEIHMLKVLDKLCTTQGYKVLYYVDDGSAYKTFIDALGSSSSEESETHLKIRCVGLDVNTQSTGNIQWVLRCRVEN